MTQSEILDQLQFFYSLELQQADMYTGQSRQAEDAYVQGLFRHLAEIEEHHAERIAGLIRGTGGSPTIIGGVLGHLTGRVTGMSSPWAGMPNLLRMDIALEKKAMEHYQIFIVKTGGRPELRILWANLVDEDLHAAWLARKLAVLSGGRQAGR